MKPLTETEYRIAGHVASGLSEKEVAAMCHISPKTVHNHTYNIRKKWNCRSAVDIARKFILQLDNPRNYFAAIAFLLIQSHIIINCISIDIRKSPRKMVRSHRIARVKIS